MSKILKEAPQKLIPAFELLTKLKSIQDSMEEVFGKINTEAMKTILMFKREISETLKEFESYSARTLQQENQQVLRIEEEIRRKMSRNQKLIGALQEKKKHKQFYKCQCSKEVFMQEELFLEHVKKKCKKQYKYNSHIFNDGWLVQNPLISRMVLKKLYLLQNMCLSSFYICNCGEADTIFLSKTEYQMHCKEKHYNEILLRYCNKKEVYKLNKWKIQHNMRQLQEKCFSLEKTELQKLEEVKVLEWKKSRLTKRKEHMNSLKILFEGKIRPFWILSLYQRPPQYCQVCKIFFFNHRNKKNNKLLEHMKKHNSNRCIKILPIKEVYQKQLQKLQREDKELYKCGCSQYLFQNSQEYIRHVQKEHKGKIQYLSSHIFKNQQLILSPTVDQSLILQLQITPEIYRCGYCKSSSDGYFKYQNQYVLHLKQKHSQQMYHPENSHYILDQTMSVVQDKSEDRDQEIFQQKNFVESEEENESVNVEQFLTFNPYKVFDTLSESYHRPFFCSSCNIFNMSKEGFLNHLAEQKKNSNHYRGTDFVFINIGKDYRKKKVFILPLKDEDWLRENEEMIIKINCKHFDRMVFLNTRQFLEHMRFYHCKTFNYFSHSDKNIEQWIF